MEKQPFAAKLNIYSYLGHPLRKDEYRFLLINIVVMLLACSAGMDAGSLSIDDYALYFDEKQRGVTEFIYAQGRVGVIAGRWLLHQLGAVSTLYVSAASFALIKLQLMLGAIITLRVLRISHINIFIALAGTFFVIHPYSSEIATFRIFSGYIAFSGCILLAFIGWAIMPVSRTCFVLGALANVYLLVNYQPLINIMIVLTIMGFVYQRISAPSGRQPFFSNEFVIRAAGILLAIVLSYGVFLYCKSISTAVEARTPVSSLSGLWDSLGLGLYIAFEAIAPIGDNGFLRTISPTFTLWFTSLGVLLLIVNMGYRIHTRTTTPVTKTGQSLLVLVGMFLSVLCLAGINIVVNNFYGIRIVTGIAAFLLVVFVLNEQLAFHAIAKAVNRVCIVLICLSYIIVNNNIYGSMKRINELDRHRANRMIYDLEKIKDFKEKVIVLYPVNAWNQYEKAELARYGDMNVSAFFPQWSSLNGLQYVSGYRLKAASGTDVNDAKAYYEKEVQRGNPPPLWPAANAIIVEPERIIVYY